MSTLKLPTEPQTVYQAASLLIPGPVSDGQTAAIKLALKNDALEVVLSPPEKVQVASATGTVEIDLQRLVLTPPSGNGVDAWKVLSSLREKAALRLGDSLDPALVVGMSLEYVTANGTPRPTGMVGTAADGIDGGAYSPSGPPKS